MAEPTTSAEPPFDFAQIRRSAYDLLAELVMDFENGKPDENVRYRAPVRVLDQLSRSVGGAKPPHLIGNGKLSSNPFGDGVTFQPSKEPITVGFIQWQANGETSIVEEPAPPSDVRVRAARLSSDRDALALQRLWEVASDLQIYFGLDPLILEVATNEPRRQSPNARERGEPLPSHIIPRLQEAIRLLDEQHPVSTRPALETWLTILTDLDKKFPSFRPTIEFDPGPCISDKWAGVVTGHDGRMPILVEKPETQPFRPLRRLASGLVPLLESIGVSLPDDAGSNAHGRLLFWAWHVHNGTTPTLPSWEIELEKVLPPGLGAFSIIKSAIFTSVNPDGSAKLSSPKTSVTPAPIVDPAPPEPPIARYLDLIVNTDRCEVSRAGEKYAHIQPIKLAGDAEWPMFLALYRKAGDELTKADLAKFPSATTAAKSMAKSRLNAKLLPLDVKVPPSEWRLIDAG